MVLVVAAVMAVVVAVVVLLLSQNRSGKICFWLLCIARDNSDINDRLILGLDTIFSNMPPLYRAVDSWITPNYLHLGSRKFFLLAMWNCNKNKHLNTMTILKLLLLVNWMPIFENQQCTPRYHDKLNSYTGSFFYAPIWVKHGWNDRWQWLLVGCQWVSKYIVNSTYSA